MDAAKAKSFEKTCDSKVQGKKVSVTFECASNLAQAIEDEARARKSSISSVIRMALEIMLSPRLLNSNMIGIPATQKASQNLNRSRD